MSVWLVSAEASRARIFTPGDPQTPLRELATLTNPAGRLHNQQLNSDRPGRTFDRMGKGRHEKQAHADSRQQEVIRFAKRITEYLESNGDKFDRLILVAAPAFLGLLRESCSKKISNKIVKEMDKNIVRLNTEDIIEILRKQA